MIRPLSRREIEALELAMGGRTNKEIAQRMGITEQTVKQYFDQMFNKTGMSGKLEVMMCVLHNPGWLGLEEGSDGN